MALIPFDGELDAPATGLVPFNGNLDGDSKKQNRGILGDIGTGLKRGVEQIPGMVTGLADIAAAPVSAATGINRPFSRSADWLGEKTGFQPEKWAKQAESEYSPEMQQSLQNVQDADGFFPTIGAIAQNPRAAVNLVSESLPSTLAGGILARGAMGAVAGAEKLAAMKAAGDTAGLLKAGAIAGGIGEGAVTAGQQMAQTDYNVDPLKAAGTASAAGLITGAIGAGSGRLANSAIGRKLGLSDIETSIAAGTLGQNAAKAGPLGYAKRIGAGIAQEGLLEEAPQSYSEQVWQNLANDKPWNEGAASAAAQGAVAGGIMGGGVNAIPRSSSTKPVSDTEIVPPATEIITPQPTTLPDTGPISRAANAGIETDATSLDTQPIQQSAESQFQRLAELELAAAQRPLTSAETAEASQIQSALDQEGSSEPAPAEGPSPQAPESNQAADKLAPFMAARSDAQLANLSGPGHRPAVNESARAEIARRSASAPAAPAVSAEQPAADPAIAGKTDKQLNNLSGAGHSDATRQAATAEIARRVTAQPQQITTSPLQQTATRLNMPGGIAAQGPNIAQAGPNIAANPVTNVQAGTGKQANGPQAGVEQGAAQSAEGLTPGTPEYNAASAVDAASQPKTSPAPAAAARRSGPQSRDDLLSAILRVTGGKGIHPKMAQTIVGDKANAATKVRGLFTLHGQEDLDDIAELLRIQENYDVRDGNHLAELVRQQAGGDPVYSMERVEREAAANAEKEYKQQINRQAEELGLKKIGGKRTLAMVEAEIINVEAERAAMEADQERAAIQAEAVFSDPQDITEADIMRWLSQDVFGAYEQEDIDRAEEDRANRENARAEANAAAAAEESAQGRAGERAQDGRAETGVGRAQERARADEGFDLAGQTPAEVRQQESARVAAESEATRLSAQEAADKKAAEKKSLEDAIKARAENPDNFQFGEDAKAAAKPMGSLFDQPTANSNREEANGQKAQVQTQAEKTGVQIQGFDSQSSSVQQAATVPVSDGVGDVNAAPENKEGDWLEELFNKFPDALPESPKPAFSDSAIAFVRRKIDATISTLEASRAEWAAKVYKRNRTQVELQGDGPSNRASLSIGSINEKKRERAIALIDGDIRGLKKFLQQLGSDPIKAIESVGKAVTGSESQGFIDYWSGLRDSKGNEVTLSTDERAQMNIANEILGDKYYGRTPATVAILSAYREAIAPAQQKPADPVAQPKAEPAKAQEPAAANEAFVKAPDGSIDFGEITEEQSKTMRRQPGVIRLTEGIQNADGTGHGLVHIEANHGKQIRNAGFASVEEFVSHVAKDFGQIWQATGVQLLASVRDGKQHMMYVELEQMKDKSGEYYRVNSAFPVRQEDYPEKHGFKKLWDGSEPASAVAGKQPAFAGQPDSESGQTTPNARGQSNSSVANQQDDGKPAAVDARRKIEDAGETLVWNKKNPWMRGGVTWDAIKGQNDTLRATLVKKEKVWPRPKWEDFLADLPENMQKAVTLAARTVKDIYDAIPTAPADKSDAGLQTYIEAVTKVRDASEAFLKDEKAVVDFLTAVSDNSKSRLAGMQGQQINIASLSKEEYRNASRPVFSAVFPKTHAANRVQDEERPLMRIIGSKAAAAMQVDTDQLIKAMKDIENGWPASREAWERQGYQVVSGDGISVNYYTGKRYGTNEPYVSISFKSGKREISSHVVSGALSQDDMAVQKFVKDFSATTAGKFLLLDKRYNIVSIQDTEDKAKEAARDLTKRTAGNGPKETGTSVDQAVREGVERRTGDVTEDQTKEAFGFRGVNFGKYVKQDQRQAHLNAAFDALHDLADTLGIPPKALGLNGMLGLAIGAQGSGSALAHFIPGQNEINITRDKGAGSLAHEWGHALDHYFATQAGLSRNEHPFLSEHATRSPTIQRYAMEDGRRVVKTEPRFSDGIRPEIVAAFADISNRMSKIEVAREEHAANQDAAIEAAQADLNRQIIRLGLPEKIDSVYRGMGQTLDNAKALLAKIRSGDIGEYVVFDDRSRKREKPAGGSYIKTLGLDIGLSVADMLALHNAAFSLKYAKDQKAASNTHLPQKTTAFKRESSTADREKGGKPYWSTTLEMFARSFESFVFDRVRAGGSRNDYLVRANKESSNLYPQGAEREAINAAFKTLVDSIETKETDQGIALMEERAVYSVNEPDAFTGDIFQGTDHALPDSERRAAPAQEVGRGQDVNRKRASRVLAVREVADTPGVYHVSAQLVTVGKRQLPVKSVKTSEDAARAFAHLSRFAVEHMDGLVTDKNGKPLAIIGAFKGAPTTTSVYPSTVMMELARIKGAANLWLSHNHPSGLANLSDADKTLSRNFRQILRDTSITYRGLSAMARRGNTVSWMDDDYNNGEVQANEPAPYSVPIVERELINSNPVGGLKNPADAKRIIPELAKDSPGVVFLTAQNEIASFVPFSPEEMGELRSGSRLMKLFSAAAKSGATAALVAMPDGKVTSAQFGNIKGALGTISVGVFDGLRYDSATGEAGKTVAESDEFVATVGEYFMSRGTGAGMALRDLQAVADRIAKGLKNLPRVHVLESPAALSTKDESQKALRDFIRRAGAWEDVEGATHNGEIYLFASGLAGEARAEHVLATHEVTHYGLRGAIGKDLDAALQVVWMNNTAVRKAAAALKVRNGLKSNIEATEEVLADLRPQDLAKLAGWRRVVKSVRDWLGRIGATKLAARVDAWLKSGLDGQQQADLFVADLVTAARAWVKSGKGRPTMYGTLLADGSLAEDVAAQEKWLTAEARARGYGSIDELAEKNTRAFENLAKLWREKNPADSLLSRNKKTITVDGIERPTMNSNGKPIHYTEEGIRNFWRWIDGTDQQRLAGQAGQGADERGLHQPSERNPVAAKYFFDGRGRPRVFFHGTADSVTSFDLDHTNRLDQGWLGRGVYLSGDPELANSYANIKRGKENPNVMPLYVAIHNPLEATLDVKNAFRKRDKAWIDAWTKRVITAGHDGVVLDLGNDFLEVVAFNPGAVKSATGNAGRFDTANPDIRMSRAGSQPANPPSQWQAAKQKFADLTSPDSINTLIYNFQNKFIDLKNLRDRIKQIGGTLTDLNDAYLGEEMYHGKVMKKTGDFLDTELRPLLQQLLNNGIKKEDFETFLHARHAPEANKVLAERNPTQAMIDAGKQAAETSLKALQVQLQKAQAQGSATKAIEQAIENAQAEKGKWFGAQAFRGTEDERLSLSGMSDAEAAQFMAALSAGKRNDMNAAAAKVDAIQARTLAELEKYGLMDKAALDAWRKEYQHYVPLHRDEAHPDSASHPIGQGFSVKGDASKRRTGSNEKVTNILGHIAMQREAAITRGEKNSVSKRLYLLAAQNPDKDFWGTDRPPMLKTIDQRTGFVRTQVDPMYKNKPNVLMLRIAGKDAAIVFNKHNPEAARLAGALKNLDGQDLDVVEQTIGRATRWFAAVNTQYNPIFGVINLLRDSQSGVLNLTSTALGDKKGAVAKGVPAALKAIYQAERGITPSNAGMAALWREFQTVGGQTGYRDLFASPEDRGKALEKELKALERGPLSQRLHAMADWLSDYNTVMENGVRLSAYKVALDQGMSKERAASLAKNLTVNFNRKGAKAAKLGAFYAFFNASVQGTERLAKTMAGPAGRKILMGGIALGVLQQVLGIMMMGGGDDDEWEKIPDFVKERSLIFPMGGGYFVSIPMPLGFNVLPNIGRLFAEWAMGGKEKPTGAQIGKLMNVVLSSFNPVGGNDLVDTISPTVSDPVVSLLRNKDWTGRPIYREDMASLDPTPGFTRTKDSATPWAKGMSYVVNMASGGTDYTPGRWSPTPDQIDYVIGQVTGGVGRELGKAAQTGAALTGLSNDELPIHKVPLAGRLLGSTAGTSGQSGRFYENIRELNGVEREIKGRVMDGKDIDAYVDSEPLAGLVGYGNGAERQVKMLRERRRALSKEGDSSGAREIDGMIAETMKGLNTEMRSARR